MKFFRIPFNSDEESGVSESRSNRLQKYIHAQSVQDMSRLASEISPDVRQIIASNVQALLGYLPPNEFNTSIMASKENFQNLLASAMLTGYFMHAMENRMHMDALYEDTPRPEANPLQDPDTLFGTQDSLIEAETLGGPEQLELFKELYDEDHGRFLSAQELEVEIDSSDSEPEQLNIQLEINTRMNRAELARLLKELREFQGRQEQPQEYPKEQPQEHPKADSSDSEESES
jgi:hypothetical protein